MTENLDKFLFLFNKNRPQEASIIQPFDGERLLRAFVKEVFRKAEDKERPFEIDYCSVGFSFDELVKEFGLGGRNEKSNG